MLLFSGAMVSNRLALEVHSRASFLFTPVGHKLFAESTFLFVLTLAIWQAWARQGAFIWLSVALGLAAAGAGMAPQPIAPQTAFLHALLAHLLLATLVGNAVLLAPAARPLSPTLVQNYGLMKKLANATMLLLVMQVSLGAAFRHGLMEVLSHVMGAFVIALIALGLTMILTQTSGTEPARPFAVVVILLAALQIAVGLTIISWNGARNPEALLGLSALHTTTGSATFAGYLGLTLLIRRRFAQDPNPPADDV